MLFEQGATLCDAATVLSNVLPIFKSLGCCVFSSAFVKYLCPLLSCLLISYMSISLAYCSLLYMEGSLLSRSLLKGSFLICFLLFMNVTIPFPLHSINSDWSWKITCMILLLKRNNMAFFARFHFFKKPILVA